MGRGKIQWAAFTSRRWVVRKPDPRIYKDLVFQIEFRIPRSQNIFPSTDPNTIIIICFWMMVD
jgi:hypothetical protein